ncbi:MAG: STAS domain-containing protein [Oscillospiraceae bacterium]|jgi:stage II sporulation protein AA (anti-sigma F factor antagonist)|nr:STAS domain-containing protein [Oscillospiraceae bacterium]
MITYESGAMRVSLAGDIDHHSANSVYSEVRAAITRELPRSLVMDFTAVSFCDSSAIALVVRTKKLMDELLGSFAVENLGGQPLKVMRASKLVAC